MSKKRVIVLVGLFVFILLVFFIVVILKSSNEKKKLIENNRPANSDNVSEQIMNSEEILKNVGILKNKFSFSKYEYKKSIYKPSIPSSKIALNELYNLNNFENKSAYQSLNPIVFSESRKLALKNNNFFIAQNNDDFFRKNPEDSSIRVDDWVDLYSDIGGPSKEFRAPENSVFITSDFMLHIYHRLLEKEFEYIEQKEFYPRLQEITHNMLDISIDKYNNSNLISEKESYQRLISYFAVPESIINSSYDFYKNETIADDSSDSKEAILANLDTMKDEIPSVSYDLARQEIELVMIAESAQLSPLFGKYQSEQGLSFMEDYTQYGPRSHYAKNPVLRSYFRSMMWYGRVNFLAKSPELTQDAINIVLLMNQLELLDKWQDIYVPTTFFVGESDDLGLYEYQKVLQDNINIPQGGEFVTKIQEDIIKLKNPQIMSSLVVGEEVLDSTKEELQNQTKGFRFMGQRFTPDAFIFSSLTQGDEKPDKKTGERLPSMPTALMVMTSLGNKTAESELADWIVTDALKSKNVINDRISDLKIYFSGISEETMTQNIYWSWLYTLQSLSQEDLDKDGYPNFMKNEDWNKKNLQSFMGSWTELKHDTLLYAKQSYAELGGGGDEGGLPPVPKGYVEPNIEFLDRLIALLDMTKKGLMQRNLLDQEFQGRNEKLADSLRFFRKIAIAELNNEKISDLDFERLRRESGKLSSVISPLPSEDRTEDLARSALIADVHTDGLTRQILYEADGIPNYIYVAVKDSNGTRLTKGLVFSYYEFKNPLEKRLNDSDWREWVYKRDEGRMPVMPDWNKSLIK
ncbi:MAG: DUF3160 domain-containing protein [Patescibacteria group bacterium]|nr:DUF3160 domain-containing protein [Patescibacteria group bacterium]